LKDLHDDPEFLIDMCVCSARIPLLQSRAFPSFNRAHSPPSIARIPLLQSRAFPSFNRALAQLLVHLLFFHYAEFTLIATIRANRFDDDDDVGGMDDDGGDDD
jgi:hypothetical protein